jgi:hypothetical protein
MAKLKAWYKKHSKPGVQGKVKMLVVRCPKHGKVCGVPNVCYGKRSERDHSITIHCEYYKGMEFGYIKCNNPNAGGERDE